MLNFAQAAHTRHHLVSEPIWPIENSCIIHLRQETGYPES